MEKRLIEIKPLDLNQVANTLGDFHKEKARVDANFKTNELELQLQAQRTRYEYMLLAVVILAAIVGSLIAAVQYGQWMIFSHTLTAVVSAALGYGVSKPQAQNRIPRTHPVDN